jgi:hypothetical protein
VAPFTANTLSVAEVYPPLIGEENIWIKQTETTKLYNSEIKLKLEEVRKSKEPHWYFAIITQCPACNKRKTIRRERRTDVKPQDPDERKKLILRYCACAYK